ncbi:HpcH/HpaI aldolase family protein [Arthrobacter sp. FW306-2-2C-D06B]|uniref:HpcH/HpaI aldolase family protein n=1 Tax=Arthrobacter sp. FW306-2-2C-D06B TaxID=2879618 RepID=UPI001F01B9B9|nr:aldolase/citrate lyase family protein [Arthrobacter sp. FW306-2-2C-D06B]UKA60419.1 hypothetical protein LFT47_08855 [Arthrobacter sp. FW306-2-2C-D06B]
MSSKSFQSRLRHREPVLGTFLFLPSEDATEAVSRTGVDFVIIDMEHSPKNWQTVSNMIRAAEVVGVIPLVRVSTIDEQNIRYALELGAGGIVLPFVETADDVRRATDAARYAPRGNRGVCTMSRAAHYSVGRERFQETAASANEKVLIIGQIESSDAVNNIDEILAQDPGLDAIIIGRADLATSIGLTGQSEHPRVVELTQTIMDRLQARSSIPYGLAVYGPSECTEWATQGATVFVYGADVSVLVSAYQRAVAEFKVAVTPTQQ